MRPLLELLRTRPLPALTGDKVERGTAVLVAGTERCPGAAILATTAALRAGAGRIQLVTDPRVATAIATAVPEAWVMPWEAGATLPDAAADLLERASAVLVGPGLEDEATRLAAQVARAVPDDVPLLIDARALPAARDAKGQRLVLTPNENEARELVDDDADGDDADDLAGTIAHRFDATVAVRGVETVVTTTDDAERWKLRGAPTLGTAGAGDVLVGLAVGFVARGIDDETALGWAVAVHSAAGDQLAGGRSNPGYIARDLLDAIPRAIESVLNCVRGSWPEAPS